MDEQELGARERAAWAAFREAVDAIEPARRETPGVNVEGWTVKDVLWHVAHWWDDLAGTLEAMRAGRTSRRPRTTRRRTPRTPGCSRSRDG